MWHLLNCFNYCIYICTPISILQILTHLLKNCLLRNDYCQTPFLIRGIQGKQHEQALALSDLTENGISQSSVQTTGPTLGISNQDRFSIEKGILTKLLQELKKRSRATPRQFISRTYNSNINSEVKKMLLLLILLSPHN